MGAETHLRSAIGVGVGSELSECLTRVAKIKKSAYAAPGVRATVQQHYNSLSVRQSLTAPKSRVVLVDDFVTKGRPLTAAGSRINEVYGNGEVRAFAVYRTRGFDEVDQIIFPYEGHIDFDGHDANRGD